MTDAYPKRIIEVDLPIREISAHARREKSIRHGHISTLHIWWARRPLAACRAVLCAALGPDPADPHCPERFRAEAAERMRGWRTYKNIFLLDENNALRKVDLGLVHSSAADSLIALILSRLQQDDLVVDGVSPNFLVRNWPPALPEWSTRAVRDAFFASPKFPRLLNPDTVKQTICRGVEAGMLAYVVREPSGKYEPFVFRQALREADLEVADDVFLISKDDAEAYIARHASGEPDGPTPPAPAGTSDSGADPSAGAVPDGTTTSPQAGDTSDVVRGFRWTGEITPHKWMNFYTKVLARFAAAKGLKLTLTVDVHPEDGVSKAKLEETKIALRELGMSEDVDVGDGD